MIGIVEILLNVSVLASVTGSAASGFYSGIWPAVVIPQVVYTLFAIIAAAMLILGFYKDHSDFALPNMVFLVSEKIDSYVIFIVRANGLSSSLL